MSNFNPPSPDLLKELKNIHKESKKRNKCKEKYEKNQ